MVGDKSKKAKTEEENVNQINAKLNLSIEKLEEIDTDLYKLNEKAKDEVLEVKKKYSEIRRPFYDKRNEIIKSISEFWLSAFYGHPTLANLLTEEEHQILKYLSTLDVEDVKLDVEDVKRVKYGYSITFHFDSNPYFEDGKLTKTYTFEEDGTTKIKATPINWKEGKGNHEMKGNKDALPPQKSFFAWFTWSNEEDEYDEVIHDKIADIIKEKLWPNPLNYLKNQQADEENFDGDEEEEEADEDGDEEGKEEDDDEEGEDSEESKIQRKEEGDFDKDDDEGEDGDESKIKGKEGNSDDDEEGEDGDE